MPPLIEGATYSHYVARVPVRSRMQKIMARQGIQLGELIEYSIPHMKSYATYVNGMQFPNSLLCSKQTINLPIFATLDKKQRDVIIYRLTSELRD